MVDTHVYPAIGSPPPLSPPPATMTATVAVPPRAGLVTTPISLEEGDRLTFSATGQVWVGTGFGINDYKLGDNWGPGYTCSVTQSRP